MPQIEQADTFLSQAFWLVVTFGFLYVVLWKAVLPRLSSILVERQERIDEDLRMAETFKKEADEAVAAYDRMIAEAQTESQAIMRKANQELAEEAAARQAALTARIKENADAAEARIETARAEAVAGIRTVAAEVAQAATARLSGIEISMDEAEAAVADAMREGN